MMDVTGVKQFEKRGAACKSWRGTLLEEGERPMMHDAQSPSSHHPVTEHFLLLAGNRDDLADPAELQAALRRMGLDPAAVADPATIDTLHRDGAMWQVQFGGLSALVSVAAADTGSASARASDTRVNDTRAADALVNDTRAADARANDTRDAPSVCLRVQPLAQMSPADIIAESRELFKLAVLLIDLVGAHELYWSPADLWSDAARFREAVVEMLDSGMPPVLHVVAFVDTGAGDAIVTRGLRYFCGQELVLETADGFDHLARMRRFVRLAVDMAINGPIRAPRIFPGLVPGELIRMTPERGPDDCTDRVRVRIGAA